MKHVQEFYIEAASQIKKCLPIGDPMIEMLQILDPAVSQLKFPSLVPLAAKFLNIIPESRLQLLDNEWRKLSLVSLPFDSEDMEPEEFWGGSIRLQMAQEHHHLMFCVHLCGLCYVCLMPMLM